MNLDLNIKKKFKKFTLDISIQSQVRTLGLLGPSGSGKSVSLKSIAGITRPDAGCISLDGRVLFDSDKSIDLPIQERKIGYLFQDYALFPNMTVEENILAGSRESDKAQVDDFLQEFAIGDIRKKYPSQISGGQKQRVALARILISKADIILLDEPFSALDVYRKWQIELELKNWLEKYQIPAILVSHDKDEVYRFCDELVILGDGKIKDHKKTKEIFERPGTIEAARILGIKNFSRIGLRDGQAYSPDWDILLEKDSDKFYGHACIRSENLAIVEDPSPYTIGTRIENIIGEPKNFTIVCEVNRTGAQLIVEVDKVKGKDLRLGQALGLAPEDIIYLK